MLPDGQQRIARAPVLAATGGGGGGGGLVGRPRSAALDAPLHGVAEIPLQAAGSRSTPAPRLLGLAPCADLEEREGRGGEQTNQESEELRPTRTLQVSDIYYASATVSRI